jgi:hypothetical protein
MPRVMTAMMMGCLLLAVAACSSGTPTLMNLRNTEAGPDEFSVLPTEPIEVPADIAARPLPQPTPGGFNRTDPDPEGDAIAALGGNVDRAQRNAGDIVGYASRFGASADIRGVLAAEDLEFRRRNDGRVLERLFGTNVYYRAYRDMALDRYAELERMRSAGIRTPGAPPEGFQQ